MVPFQNGSFSLPPARRLRGFLFHIYCGSSVYHSWWQISQYWWWSLPGVFNLLSCLHWAFSNLSIKVQVFLPTRGSRGGFFSWVSALVSQDSLYLSVSKLGSSVLLCVLPYLMDARRIVDFLIYSAFYLLLGQHGDIQAPFMWNQWIIFSFS